MIDHELTAVTVGDSHAFIQFIEGFSIRPCHLSLTFLLTI